MSKIGKARLVERVDGKKLFFIASVNDEDEIISDVRSKKPVGFEDGEDTVYMQEINSIEFSTKKNEDKNVLSYYAPNNVGILLSIANKATIRAKEIYEKKINPHKNKHKGVLNGNTISELTENTQIMYEYLEEIQTSIVFGYTAIEAFTNLSIYNEYKYLNNCNSKGITEIYDKKAIERWVSLNVKLSEILTDIYNCKSIKEDKIWNKFKKFETCRNEIIHQKSIESTSFYGKYFDKEIFELCNIPEEIMRFFFKKCEEKGIDNALWPLLINNENIIPVLKNINLNKLEMAGKLEDK